MLTPEESRRIGLQKYRELYPRGTVPEDIESRVSITVLVGSKEHRVCLSYWLEGRRNPLPFFEVVVDRVTSATTVVLQESAEVLQRVELRRERKEEGLNP